VLLGHWVEAKGKAQRPCSPAELHQLIQDASVFKAVLQADVLAVPSLTPLFLMCLTRLQQLYGDVPGVIANDERRGAFCSLPHAAVLSWLQLPNLWVHSENCMVLLLSYWVEAQERDGQPCSYDEAQQLARAVRVGDVGPAYLAFLLPRLPLFEGLDERQPLMLMHRLSRVKPPPSLLASSPPPFWLAGPHATLFDPRFRCPAPHSALVSWSLDAEELEQLYAGQDVCSHPVYCNGFWLVVELHPVAGRGSGSDEDEAEAGDDSGSQLGLFSRLQLDKWPSSVSGLWLEQGYLTFVSAARIGGYAKHEDLAPYSAFITRDCNWGVDAALPSADAATVKELVAPYLEEGRLNVQVTFVQVDQVRTQRG
jgi:hypothetical protein